MPPIQAAAALRCCGCLLPVFGIDDAGWSARGGPSDHRSCHLFLTRLSSCPLPPSDRRVVMDARCLNSGAGERTTQPMNEASD